MGKGVGVGSIILATVGIFVPVAGIFIGWLALLLAAIAGLAGEVTLTVAVVAISVVNYLFLSPSLWLATAGANLQPGPGSPNVAIYITIVLVIAPVATLMLCKTGKVVIGRR